MSSLIPISETIISNNTGLDAITRAPIVDYETKVRCLRIQNVSHDEPFEMWGYTEVSEQNYKNFQLQKDDIIISRTGGSIGTLMYIDKDYKSVYNNGLICLKIDKERYNPRYIYYCLKLDGFKKHIQKCSLGNSTQENIRMNDMLEYMIPDFNLKIQNQIVDVLKDLDDKIQNNNAINVELESMAKTIYDYWFLQFEFPNEEGKPYKSSGGKMVWNEELKREIPEGWEVLELKEIFSFEKGKIPNELSDVKSEVCNREYITIDVANGGIPQYCESEKMVSCNGEAIMVMDGAASGDVYVGNKGILGSTFAKLVPVKSNISNNFIYWILKSNSENYKKANTGSTVPHANRKYIEAMKIALPNNIHIFSDVFDNIQNKINHNKKENQELASLREFLLPMLMNGQVGFKDGE